MDKSPYLGGAEMAMHQLIREKPEDVEIIYDFNGMSDITLIGNCTTFNQTLIDQLRTKHLGGKTISIIFDYMPNTNKILKEWLLDYSDLVIIVSPWLENWLGIPVKAPKVFIPCPVEFQLPTRKITRDKKAVYLGRLFPGKGVLKAIEWSRNNGIPLDVWGYGPMQEYVTKEGLFKGKVDLKDVNDVMSQYQYFVGLPDEYDGCPRTSLEAYNAGCEIIGNGKNGAMYWIQNEPERIYNTSQQYWDAIRRVANGTYS